MTPPNDPDRESRRPPPKKGVAPEPAGSDDATTVADLDLQELMRRQLAAEGLVEEPGKK